MKRKWIRYGTYTVVILMCLSLLLRPKFMLYFVGCEK